ncbi:hypothetical protein HK102_013122 [Quaeritorhiza haematococci]|nr:hypothetical protein HK102_013122 [Quaeritorhiza haematococci]
MLLPRLYPSLVDRFSTFTSATRTGIECADLANLDPKHNIRFDKSSFPYCYLDQPGFEFLIGFMQGWTRHSTVYNMLDNLLAQMSMPQMPPADPRGRTTLEKEEMDFVFRAVDVDGDRKIRGLELVRLVDEEDGRSEWVLLRVLDVVRESRERRKVARRGELPLLEYLALKNRTW